MNRKLPKKILALILSGELILSVVPTGITFAENNTEVKNIEISEEVRKIAKSIDASVIKSIYISSNEIYNNIEHEDDVDSINLALDLENPKSINRVAVLYRYKGDYYNGRYVDLYYNEDSGLFEGEVYSNNELGTEYISYIAILDKNNDWYGIYPGDLEYIGFDLEKYEIENKKYEPVSIEVDKRDIKPGETANIKVDLSNYPRNIKTFSIKAINDIGESEYLEFKYNKYKNIYEYSFKTDIITEGGNWSIDELIIVNQNDEYSYIRNLERPLFYIDNNIKSLVESIKISSSTSEASPGERVKVILQGLDNKYIRSVSLHYNNYTIYDDYNTNKNTKDRVDISNYKEVILYYNKNTNQFEGYFNVTPYYGYGEWKVSSISIYGIENDMYISNKDNYYYGSEYSKDLSNLNLSIDTVKDRVGPVVNSVSVDKKTVRPGETVKLIVDATDDISGIDLSSFYASYDSEITNDYYMVSGPSAFGASYNSKTKKYEIPIVIDGFTYSGEYNLSSISALDKCHNYSDENTNLDLSAASFTVVDGIESDENIISTINIDNKEPQSGDVINFSLGLKNSSNISKINLVYRHDSDYWNPKVATLKYNQATKQYEGCMSVDDTFYLGSWNLSSVDGYLDDEDMISSVSCEDKRGSNFNKLDLEVISKKGEGLTVDSITLNQKKATKNESINLNISASDIDGEIRKVSVKYISPNNKAKILNLNTLTRSFNGNIDIEQFTEPGLWQIESVTLEDNERNKVIVYNTSFDSSKDGIDLSDGNFEVYGTTLDIDLPQLIDVNVDKEMYIKGENIKVSISARDIGSRIKSVKANFAPRAWGAYDEPYVEFIYNNKTDAYEYTIDTNKYYTEPAWGQEIDGAWGIGNLIIEDNAGNILKTDNESSHILRSAYFYVDKSNSWYVDEVTDKSTSITGYTEPETSVIATINGKTYTTKSDPNGEFSITIPKQVGGTPINIVVKNIVNQVIQNVNLTVADYDAPEEPTVTTIVDTTTTTLEGKAEANSTVVIEKEVNKSTVEIARGKADSNGNFKITIPTQTVDTKLLVRAIDSSSNESTKLSVIVKQGIVKQFVGFNVDSINNKSTSITGRGVSGAKVEAYDGSTKIGSTTVNSSGKFSISIKARNTNTKIKVVISKDGYTKAEKTITVFGVATKSTKSLTKDIYKYDAGSGKFLTYINGKGYSQYSYLNTSGKYAFTPSSWMTAAGLSVSMPTSSNGYTMMIDNNYIEMKSKANELLNNIKSNKIAKSDIQKSLNDIENMSTKSTNIATTKAAPKKSLTKDIYKYDAGKGKYLTYINGKGYSQYSYLNTSGTYAFTPSSWMVAAGLTVSMPTSSNGYTMKITNQYKLDYDKIVKEIKNYM